MSKKKIFYVKKEFLHVGLQISNTVQIRGVFKLVSLNLHYPLKKKLEFFTGNVYYSEFLLISVYLLLFFSKFLNVVINSQTLQQQVAYINYKYQDNLTSVIQLTV